MKQVPYWGPIFWKSYVNPTHIWYCLLGACELIHIFMCNEKHSLIVLKMLGTTIQNLVIQGCAPLQYCALGHSSFTGVSFLPIVVWFVLHMQCYDGLCYVTLCELTVRDFVFQIWCLEERAGCLHCTTIREEGLLGKSRQCVMHLLHRFLLLKSVRSLNIFFLPSCT